MAEAAPTGWPPVRREGGRVVVELPTGARRFLSDAAREVQRSVDERSSPGFGVLLGRIDEGAEVDDPLVSLERQTAIDRLCATVAATAYRQELSDDEAEAWLRVLGMAVMLVAATARLRTDDDLARLDGDTSRVLDLLRSLQLWVAHGLDPSLGDLLDPDAPEEG